MQEERPEITSYFTDPLLLSYITSFLAISDRLTLTQLSKKVRFVMEHHFKMVLAENRLHMISKKSAIHQMRFYFDRCLRIFRTSKEDSKEDVGRKRKDSHREEEAAQQSLRLTLENPFKFNVIVFFEVGLIYTAFIDHQNRAFVFRTNQILSLVQGEGKPLWLVEPSVKQIKCKGQKLIILKQNGEIVTWQAEKKGMDICTRSNQLFWTLQIPVKSIFASFNYAVFLLENPQHSKELLLKYLFSYDYDLDMQHEDNSQHRYYFIALNLQTNAYYIVSVRAKQILSLTVGHREAYVVNEHHQCYIVEFDQVNQGAKELTARPFQPLAEKRIVSVFGGYNFFVGLQRNVQVLEEWSTEEVLAWMRDIGFGDFLKIARSQRIDGRKLKSISKGYMESVLGMSKLNMQQKFLLCIEEVLEGKNECDQIWVWGKNDYGQLGVTHANYIAQPMRLRMDFLKGNDRIDTVFCGWYQTYIRTHRGKIYESVLNCERKKKKAVEERDLELSDEERKEAEEPFRYKNKKRKKTEDYQAGEEKRKKEHHKRFQHQAKWVESQAGKAFFVESFKDYVFYIQCPGQNKFQPTKQKKLRTSKAIIDRILWDQSLNKQEFKIGLIDKDMGTIEVTLFQIQAFEYKQTSIRYVKRNKAIVWDRESKIDHL